MSGTGRIYRGRNDAWILIWKSDGIFEEHETWRVGVFERMILGEDYCRVLRRLSERCT